MAYLQDVYYDLVAMREEWEELVLQAARQQDGRGIPRPVGLDPHGRYSLKRDRREGYVRYTLYYMLRQIDVSGASVKCNAIGRFSVRPEDVRTSVEDQDQAAVPVGRILTPRHGWPVRIEMDVDGLPNPVLERQMARTLNN